MNKKLDKKITQSKPNLKASKSFTNDVMQEISKIDPRKERRFKLLQGFRPAFAMAIIVFVAGATVLAATNSSSVTHKSEDSEEIKLAQQETIGFESESEQLTSSEANNTQSETSEEIVAFTDEQLTAPTTITQAKVEMETIVVGIESDVATFDADLDFSDEILSDDALSLEL